MVKQYADSDVQQAHDQVFAEHRSPFKECLPPSMSKAHFHDMIQALRVVVGEDQVHTGESLLHFSDPFSAHTENFPSAAVWFVEILVWFIPSDANTIQSGICQGYQGHFVFSEQAPFSFMDCIERQEPGVSEKSLQNCIVR